MTSTASLELAGSLALPAAVGTHMPSASQREAIEAPAGPILVLAGPGAGKTFCLTERIRHIVERDALDADRICAFTFTNKAAGEIAERLERTLGEHASRVRTGTIHSFCAELLRELGTHIDLEPGFGIADEIQQRVILRRVGAAARSHRYLLGQFTLHRFVGHTLVGRDAAFLRAYEEVLAERNVLDFDMLLLRAARLFESEEAAALVRSRWACVLVDEFQDLNRVQYRVIRALAREHRNIFAVGDDEQSIYSWNGADPKVFRDFVNDFGIARPVKLQENRRCPRQVMSLARRLIEANTPIFADRGTQNVHRDSAFEVVALTFPSEDAEIAWILDDLRRDRDTHELPWGEYALLYRQHRIGHVAEAGFLNAGLPCRLAQGRALAEDPACAYVIAAVRVIASPDDLHQESFFEVVLPKPLLDDARARAEEGRRTLMDQLQRMARELPKEHGDGRKIRRGFATVRNLPALGVRHRELASLVEELLSQRVGQYRTVLEEHHDSLSDPAIHEEVRAIADRLDLALSGERPVWFPRMRGLEIALEGMLVGIGVRTVRLGGPRGDALTIEPRDAPALGLGLAVFKAAQLVRSRGFTNAFRDFTTIDLETTDRSIDTAEIVEVGAVRVRDGRIDAEFHALVRPRVPISARATEIHGYTDADVAHERHFEDVWPELRSFCGRDVLVAHNGYSFDFPILRRMASALPGGNDLLTYDSLPLARDLQPGSARLPDLARLYGVDPGRSHRACDDCRTLAHVFLALGEAKVVRARKTALVNLLDYLALALVLDDGDRMSPETDLLRNVCAPFALGRYSDCIEHYRAGSRLCQEDAPAISVAELIQRLGGERLMDRLRAEKSADQRYPYAMARLRRLISQCGGESLTDQMTRFLERVALSRTDGVDLERDRVNLLTLHSTKGLEFSRVYILGAEDAQLVGGTPSRPPSTLEIEEARRLLYVGMTRAKDRLVLTRVATRDGRPTGGHRFLNEMGLAPRAPS